MRVTFDQCDSTDEIVGLFNKVFANQEQLEAKIVQNAQEIEALKPKKGKSKMKSKGSVLTRTLASIMLIAMIAGLCFAAYVPTDINYDIASNPESLSIYLRDVTSNMRSNSYLFNPTTTLNRPPNAEGRIYYDSDTNEWIGYNATGWTAFAVASGASLNASYAIGATITANDGTVTIQTTDADANPALTVIHSGADASGHGIFINVSGAAAKEALKITNTGTGYDIEGTAGFTLSKTGQIVGLDLDLTGANGITLSNDETITNAADGKITFTTNGGTANTLIFDLQAGATAVQLESGDVVEFQFGDVDALTQIGTIAFDTSETASITASGGGGEDFTVTQAATGGGADASLILHSAGTGLDAIILLTNNDGGIDIDADEDISITVTSDAAGEDLLLTQTGGQTAGIIITSSGIAGSAIKLETTNANGDIWIDSGDDLIIDVAGLIDFDIVGEYELDVAAGLNLTSSEASDGAITLTTSNAAGNIIITSADTTADGIDIDSAGGIDIDAATAIAIDNAAGDIRIDSAAGSIEIIGSEAAAADAINIDATGANSGIDLDTTNGPITLTAADGTNGDITLDAADIMTFTSADTKIFDGAITETWVIEGTADGFETTIEFTDPTANGTITFPDTADEGATGGAIAWMANGGTVNKDASDAALPVTDAVVLGTSSGASAWSLPNGEEGQILTVVIVSDGGAATITPDTAAGCGWATVVLTTVIEGVTFMYVDDTIGWIIIGTFGDGTNLVTVTQ